jgi:hypothetical protein
MKRRIALMYVAKDFMVSTIHEGGYKEALV